MKNTFIQNCETLYYLLSNVSAFLTVSGFIIVKYQLDKKRKKDDVEMIRGLHKLGNLKSVSTKDGKVEFFEEQKKEKSPT